MTVEALEDLRLRRIRHKVTFDLTYGITSSSSSSSPEEKASSSLSPDSPKVSKARSKKQHIAPILSPLSGSYLPSLSKGLRPLMNTPVLVIGVQSDVLFPHEQQRELADALRRNEDKGVIYYELDSPFGHDTFL